MQQFRVSDVVQLDRLDVVTTDELRQLRHQTSFSETKKKISQNEICNILWFQILQKCI